MRESITNGLVAIFGKVLLASFLAMTILAQPGALDPTFGIGGKVIDGIIGADEAIHAVAVQQDGKIVGAGYVYRGFGAGFFPSRAMVDFAVVRYNTDGSLDPTFGNGGKVRLRIHPSINVLTSVAIQPDGKILAAGWSGGVEVLDFVFRFSVLRFNPDGSLDPSFGSGGFVTTLISESSQPYSMAIGSDGKIVVAGSACSDFCTNVDFAIARYNPDGSLDGSFGSGGFLTTQVGPGASTAFSVGAQPDGRIVAAGYAESDSSDNATRNFATVRYSVDGSPDQTFGGSGHVITAVSQSHDWAGSMAIQLDGKIIAAGWSTGPAQILIRYNPDGSLDAAFGSGGIVATPATAGDNRGNVVVQTDGKIIAPSSNASDFTLMRYTPQGVLDSSFGSNGIASTAVGPASDFRDSARAAAVQADGRIVAAGYADNGADVDIALARFQPDGSLDTSFDSDGKVMTAFGIYRDNRLYNVFAQPDGRIVTGGNPEYSVIRYDPDGSRDTSFNSSGHTSFGASSMNGGLDVSVTVQPDGKTVVAGMAYYGDMFDMALDVIRYNSDGTKDTSFGNSGHVNFHPGTWGNWSDAAWVHILPDGKIVAGGGDRIFRLNTNGSLDTSFGGGDGIADVPSVYAYASAIQSSGKIVVAGPNWVSSGIYNFGVARLDPDGTLDPTFGTGGLMTLGPDVGWGEARDSLARTVAIQPDGKIVAGGDRLVRLNENGSLDSSFGINGIVTPPMEKFRKVVIEPDGKLLIAGTSNGDFGIARFNHDGSPDTSFGGGDGLVTVDFGDSNERANGLTLDAQGRAIVVGESNGAFALARLLLTPRSISGRVLTASGLGLRNATVRLIDPDGTSRTTTTSSFGNYTFENVTSGDSYTLTVASKRFRFSPRVVQVSGDLTNVDLVGLE